MRTRSVAFAVMLAFMALLYGDTRARGRRRPFVDGQARMASNQRVVCERSRPICKTPRRYESHIAQLKPGSNGSIYLGPG